MDGHFKLVPSPLSIHNETKITRGGYLRFIRDVVKINDFSFGIK